ncbi:NADPH-dependent FMN reductase [Actinomycetospora termitidis]|uniref:NAD(P)H-dependent oxidoreductase n=1 Tax=Actinomycetospora termitidis TaxID=3053470 RepID=A0ABT7M4Z3_9PSEU|nr:NAD(P)H-dependent oxidoreductase [Actinomycetospora sp. Odt1-22]MDL5155628.1 NAD(P)H-dependent oxidoreductase [Actinomycetospora sp. Odt1-22]
MKLEIIIASTRPGRIGPTVAEWMHREAVEHGGFDEVELVDLAEVDLPFFNEPKHPRLGDYVHEHTKAWSAMVASADAFVIVMPEYNFGYNAELKNALDYLHAEWRYKPVGLVSYGGVSAGTRAAQMLKQVLTTLRMTPVFEAVSLPFVNQMIADGEFVPNEIALGAAKAMLDELLRTADALAPLRA